MLMAKLYLWALDPKTNPKMALSAARAIIAAEAQNQLDEHKLLDLTGDNGRPAAEQGDARFLTIASELGITLEAVRDASGAASVDPRAALAGREK